ncbi:MmgE/PrpD family protein [Microtetraspora fusca]|uniref:MmgE/PrpD family protein n=1 Tax=Microtetraspora fusca TaxID=1997 RepID=UPI00082CEBDB
MTSLSHDLAVWAHEAWSGGRPADVDEAARFHVIDTVAVAIAGAGDPATRSMAAAVNDSDDALEQALILGTAAHALDYDNAQAPSLVHPSCVVVPAMLAAGAQRDLTIDQVVRAVAVAEEVSLWLGESAVRNRDSSLFERGFHPTAVCCPIGAATGVALLNGLDVHQTAHAIGAAASMSGGILEGNRTGGQIKPMHAGFAARAGVFAAGLAVAGATAAPTALEGRFGFAHAFLDGAELQVADLPVDQRTWRVTTVTTKPYPVNGFIHSAVDAALELRHQGFTLEPGATLTIGVAEPVLRTIAEPRADKVRPATAYAARFSGPVVVALALRGGTGLGVGLNDFPASLPDDTDLLEAAARVEFRADPRCTEVFPAAVSAAAQAVGVDGRSYSAVVDHALGSPRRPLTRDQQWQKFDDCVAPALGSTSARALWDSLARARSSARCADVVNEVRRAVGRVVRQAGREDGSSG